MKVLLKVALLLTIALTNNFAKCRDLSLTSDDLETHRRVLKPHMEISHLADDKKTEEDSDSLEQ